MYVGRLLRSPGCVGLAGLARDPQRTALFRTITGLIYSLTGLLGECALRERAGFGGRSMESIPWVSLEQLASSPMPWMTRVARVGCRRRMACGRS